MKGKIVKGRNIEEWKEKYGSKDNLEIIAASEVQQNPSILDNKKWWLIDNKYYQVPAKKWLIPVSAVLGAGLITTSVVTPVLCARNCSTVTTKIYFDDNHTTNTIGIGNFLNLAEYLHVEGTTEKPTWATSDPTKVTVDNDGQIIGQGDTTTSSVTITASIDNGKKSATCKVTVDPTIQKKYLTLKNEGTSDSNLVWTKPTVTTDTSWLKYSTDGITWTDATSGSSVTIANNTELYLKGNFINTGTAWGTSSKAYNRITITNGNITLSGNLMNLLQSTEDVTPTTLPNDYALTGVFAYSSAITKIAEDDNTKLLPVVNIDKKDCYTKLFWHSGLISIPEKLLPATVLAAENCYSYMFSDCTSLANIPENFLPATTLYASCYATMFYGCSSLTTLPNNLLPATALSNKCYFQMFSSCTGLTAIPEKFLPATTLANSCYNEMFKGCTSLKTLPNNLLPASTLMGWCYQNMFNGCSILKISEGEPTGQATEKGIIFTCPSLEGLSYPVTDMFTGTGGTFTTGTPEANKIYYWYI